MLARTSLEDSCCECERLWLLKKCVIGMSFWLR